jgi:UDP-glucose 4-epimerase
MNDEAYRGVRALVLGGSGFIGAWTARMLHARGAVVMAAARDPWQVGKALGPVAAHVSIAGADLEQASVVANLIAATRPAVVFNLAGYGVDRSERRAEKMLAMGPELVGALCEALASQPSDGWAGMRLVHTGSGAEYGRLDGPVTDASRLAPVTDYGRAKLQATEHLQARCAETGLRGVVARLFTVYGPGEPSDRLLPTLMRTARTGVPLALTSGRQRRDFTYIADVAEGLLRLGSSGARAGEAVNLATGCLSRVRDFIEAAAGVLGISSACLQFGALPDRDDETWHGEVDLTRLRELTGWVPPTSMSEGVRRSRDWDDGQ